MIANGRACSWIALYGVTLGTLILLAFGVYIRLPGYREPPVNFRAMKEDDRFNVYALTRRQEGSVKLGYAENFPPPEIGIFGNHIVQHFGGEAVGNSDPAFFLTTGTPIYRCPRSSAIFGFSKASNGCQRNS